MYANIDNIYYQEYITRVSLITKSWIFMLILLQILNITYYIILLYCIIHTIRDVYQYYVLMILFMMIICIERFKVATK